MKKHIIATALALPFALYAHAQDTSAVHISGFGTGALTSTDNDQAEFVRPNQSRGVRKNLGTGIDSNLGLQADYHVNDWISLTGQGLVRKDAADDFGAELSWAFAKFKLSDELSFRIGRMGLPVFMISDYRNVGYANTFLRPPSEVYSQVLISSFDGIDATWSRTFTEINFTAQAAIGSTKADIPSGSHVEVKKLRTLNLSAEHGPFTLRFGRTEWKLTLADLASLNSLVSAFDGAGKTFQIGQLNDMARLIEIKNQKGTFTSVGASMDWNNVIAQSEYAKRKLDGYSNASNSWYALGGYRFGKFLPYYSHARLIAKSEFTNTIPTACAVGASVACTPTVMALRSTMEVLRTASIGQSQSTDTIGLRWDFARSADVKFQIDRIKPEGTGLFVVPDTGFHGPVTVGSVAVDFVF